ncbi:MAG: methanogenesis marker protein Mmp4/MtxX [Methanomassiliicoccaceae archaeon]|jgi:putative methanogen marker protein 4|nr:methanogenesis marker protein Mmp4/MtxX [Methanomassiliicoccaceae archaeon]
MFTYENLLKDMPKNVTVGIGRGSDKGNVEMSASAFDNVIIYDDPDALLNDLRNGKIDAAVRGDMSSSKLMPLIRDIFRIDEIERSVIVEPVGKRMIFVAPVGIDEGSTVQQKYDIAVKNVNLMRRIGMGERIAVMSGGRADDKGRSAAVDRTIDEALELVDMLSSDGYDAYHAEILIESAADEADLLIAPDGITGNIIFRTLHFLGNAKALGAPVLNINKVFVDTSRVKTDYRDSIALAMRLTR